MPLIELVGVDKYYGADRILAGVDLALEPGCRAALIGRNGCGKTTLLRLIADLEEADGGVIHRQSGITIGLLAQEPQDPGDDRTLYGQMEAVFADLLRLEREIQEATARMAAADRETAAAAIRRYDRLQAEFESRGGYHRRSRIERVLHGLGLDEILWHQPLRFLSGGERTRAALAALLLKESDIILLDEPTNHLDISAISWLEDYLRSYSGSVLTVSHDRYFLDRVVDTVYELAEGAVRRYKGNYSDYRARRAEERMAAAKALAVQTAEIERERKLIREATADERSKKQARSRVRRLEKIKPVKTLPGEKQGPQIKLAGPARASRLVLTVENLGKMYEGRTILKDVSFSIEAGERVGIIGPNGAGKTTLLQLLLGLVPSDGGQCRFGHNVVPGYLAQHVDSRMSGTVFSYMQSEGAGDNLATRSHLARYLFYGEDVFKNTADLSGGEKRRLALARLTLSGANLLILDEPTNHLDLPAMEALEEALTDYGGTVLAVSHDRYFLGRVTGRLLALIGGNLLPFASYSEYADWQAEQESLAAAERAAQTTARRELHQRELDNRRAPTREERRRRKQAEAYEAQLIAKEEERRDLLAEMARPEIAADFVVLHDLSVRLARIEEETARLYEEWEAVLNGIDRD